MVSKLCSNVMVTDLSNKGKNPHSSKKTYVFIVKYFLIQLV